MLQKLTQLKNYTSLQLVSIKLNLFVPKLYKLNAINFLVILYTNLKNSTLKVTYSRYPLLSIYLNVTLAAILYFVVETLCWVI